MTISSPSLPAPEETTIRQPPAQPPRTWAAIEERTRRFWEEYRSQRLLAAA
jgi:hypothetical protein